jgi:hypothetical protein
MNHISLHEKVLPLYLKLLVFFYKYIIKQVDLSTISDNSLNYFTYFLI